MFSDIYEDKFPQKPALVSFDSGLTYALLRDRVREFFSALRNPGVKRGHRVATHLLNGPENWWNSVRHSKLAAY